MCVRLLPVADDVRLAFCTPWLECHLEGIGLYNEERVRLIEGRIDRSALSVEFAHEVEGPKKTTARDECLISRDSLAQTCALAPAERGHSDDGWVLGERFLVGRPARLEPAFGLLRCQ